MDVNIVKIAKEAKTSIATVSRVINNSEKVRSSTRRRILKIIEAYGYQPKIRKNKTTNICVLINEKRPMFSTYTTEILNGITDTITEMNLEQTILFIDEKTHEQLIMDKLREQKIDAGILLLTHPKTHYLQYLKKEQFPFVLINNSASSDFNYIDTDNYVGVYQALEYLYQLNHKKYILLLDDTKFANYQKRKEAFLQFCQDKNLPQQRIFELKNLNNYSNLLPIEHGFYFMEEFIKTGFDETVILASNDDAAMGILSSCHIHNIDVPNDLSIIGYDNYKNSNFTVPTLTSINQNLYNLGREAVLSALSTYNNAAKNNVHKKFSSDLVIRKSVKALS